MNKIKDHIVRNKNLYIGFAVGVGVGVTTTVLLTKSVSVAPIVIGKDNTVITEIHLARRGHPGNIIRCISTGEIFASQKRAALANGVNPGTLSNHLAGHTTNVNGLVFEKLGEAA